MSTPVVTLPLAFFAAAALGSLLAIRGVGISVPEVGLFGLLGFAAICGIADAVSRRKAR